jgi:hypothetical protein
MIRPAEVIGAGMDDKGTLRVRQSAVSSNSNSVFLSYPNDALGANKFDERVGHSAL